MPKIVKNTRSQIASQIDMLPSQYDLAPESFDIIVAGGGIVGLCGALAMRMRGHSVALIDACELSSTQSASKGRVFAINQASQQLLQQLDVWQQLDITRISAYRHMCVWDAATAAQIEFDATMVGQDRLGTIVEESSLKHTLIQRAEHLGVALFSHCPIEYVEPSAQTIMVGNSHRRWQAELLMIADGIHSPLRQCLNVKVTQWPYHHHAIVCTVHNEKKHQHTAYQVFNSDGPLAFLPLADQHQTSIVWSTSPQHAKALMAADASSFSHQLTQAFSHRLGQSKLIGQRYQFPLSMRHVQQYCGSRWLLMGDAAHTIHPLAGLGLNIGLADLRVWLEYLDKTPHQQVNFNRPLRILGQYQRQRKASLWQTILLMESLKAIFLNPLPPVAALRQLGIQIGQRSLLLKRLFIEYASY